MKKLLLSLLFISGIAASGYGQQVWSYNFGVAATTSYSINNSSSETFLPTPQSAGGTARVKISNGGGGSFSLTNPGVPAIGSGAQLDITAPSTGSVNKFSIYDFANATSAATIKFKIRFNNSSSGTWYFLTGDGASFSDNNAIANAEVFAGLRFQLGAGSITTNNRVNATWSSAAVLPTNSFSQETTYEVELYLNNSTNLASYTRGTGQSIASDKYDIWINGVLIGDDVSSGSLTPDNIIDSFMFYGENSTANSAILSIDEISYSNFIVPTTLPVSLTSFTAKANLQNIDLAWATASEKDNSHFDILRSGDGKTFAKIGDVKGNGRSTDGQLSVSSYSFTDKNALPGVNYYQLKQVDNNGTSALSKVEAVKSNVAASNLRVSANRQDGTVKLTVFAANEGNATFKIYDLNGRKITEQVLNLSKGYSNVSVPFNGGNGLHIASLTTVTETVTQKFIQ